MLRRAVIFAGLFLAAGVEARGQTVPPRVTVVVTASVEVLAAVHGWEEGQARSAGPASTGSSELGTAGGLPLLRAVYHGPAPVRDRSWLAPDGVPGVVGGIRPAAGEPHGNRSNEVESDPRQRLSREAREGDRVTYIVWVVL